MYICRWNDGVVMLAGKCDRLRMQFASGMFSRGSMDEREREREEADNTPLPRELRLPDLMDLSS